MEKNKKALKMLKTALQVALIVFTGLAALVYSVLYIDTFGKGIIREYLTVSLSVSVGIISVLTSVSVVFYIFSKEFLYKICYLTIFLIAVLFISFYYLNLTGFLDKVDSVEAFREYIASYGSNAVLLFIALQFAQVVFLPIPAFITVGAGVLLFGPLYGAIYSCIGIILGSIVAFFIGRFFGYKVVKWLIGKDTLDKWLLKIKGKDKIIMTFMFLFPFFPDDVICFVAGITTVSKTFFIVMIIITRVISIFASCYSLNNSIIPFDTWWGILLWALFFILTVTLTIVVYKKGDKLEEFIKNKKEQRKDRKNQAKLK